MNLIKKIEIKNFRSIYDIAIDDASDVNVFSGVNDVGKSNIIKSLNLFFNYQVDWQSQVDFERDTNSFHTYFSKNARKKRLISVKVTFRRPKRQYEDSLPDYFWVKRQWDRENPLEPETTWGENGHLATRDDWPRGLTWFLKKSRFYYVPAVRDRNYLLYLLGQFSQEVTESPDDELKAAGDKLVDVIQSRSSQLRGILKDVTGLEFTFELPESMLALLRAAGLYTENNIPFQLRGDGIQGLTVPGILQYLSSNARNNFHIWGFEEPENSLEYKKAAEFADMIRDRYSRNAQIFLTTHSPAFLAMENTKTTIYRVTNNEQKYERTGHEERVTAIQAVFVRGDFRENLLPRDLGLFKNAREYDRANREVENREEKIRLLEQEINKLEMPTLIVEGKHDMETLEYAWRRLYEVKMPFDIIEVNGEDGVGDLVTLLIRMPNGRTNAAVLDHDHAGINRFNKLLKQFGSRDERPTSNIFNCSDVKIMTLPRPNIPDRTEQALNKNLSMEFYFSDDFLYEIDNRCGNQLFRTDKWINDGKHIDLDEDSLKLLFDSGNKSMAHRALNNDESAKKKVVEALSELDEVDFLPFHALFEIIMGHLQPGVILSLKPSVTAVVSA